MQQIYRRLPMPKCDLLWNFIEITTRHRCFPVNLLHIFRRPFYKSTYEALLLKHQHILIPITKKWSSKNSKQGWVCISFEESLLLIKSNHLANLKECLCRSPNQNRDVSVSTWSFCCQKYSSAHTTCLIIFNFNFDF